MSEQLELGQELRDEGMTRVLEATAQEWKTLAMSVIGVLAADGRRFTSEDVRQLAGEPPRSNAMGAVIHAAARRGLIRKVGFTRAERPGMHATDLAVWVGAAEAGR